MAENDDQFDPEVLKTNEIERINTLERVRNVLYNQKIKTDEAAGTINVDMSFAELAALASFEDSIIRMKRRTYGA